MKTASLIAASAVMVADTALAFALLVAQSVSPTDAGTLGPAGWASAGTLGAITLWLFKRDYDREKTTNETIRTLTEAHAKDIKALIEANATMAREKDKLLAEKDKESANERRMLAEMQAAEVKLLRENGLDISVKHSDAYLKGLDRQHKHCLDHWNRYAPARRVNDDRPDEE